MEDLPPEIDERYGLQWPGKHRAAQEARTPPERSLRPCQADSVDWERTGNLFIEGDNLEALKLLHTGYAGKIRLIYIDPPYNTGKDFVYTDHYSERPKSGEKPGAALEAGGLEAAGRRHGAWLSMMLPRLMLARDLLREDGVLIMHIDEHEHANAAEVLGELFGEPNVLGAAVWDKRNPKGDATGLACQHESIFFVARSQPHFAATGGLVRIKKHAEAILAKAAQLFARLGKVDLPADLKICLKRYPLAGADVAPFKKKIDLPAINAEMALWMRTQGFSAGEAAYSRIDEAGDVYRLVSMAWPNKKRAPAEYFIPLKHPLTGRDCPVPERGWRNPPETMRRLLKAGRIVFGRDHSTQPQRKYLLKENLAENLPSVIAYGGSDDGLLAELGIPFENPKPVELVRELIGSVLKEDGGIVLDFFAGSGTTAHALMLHNCQTHSAARFILVQSPEPLRASSKATQCAARFCQDLGKPANLAEVTKERLRRAGSRIRLADAACDVGFRVLKL